VREGWRDFRSNNEFHWPKSPLVNWLFGVCVAILVAIAVFLAWFDWDKLRGPIARYASAATGRAVRIEGHLKVHLFSLHPWARVGGLRIGNPAWAGKGDTAAIGQSFVQIPLLPLIFARKLDLTRVELDQPNLYLRQDAQGRRTWSFSRDPNAPAKKGPPLHTLVVRNGHLRYLDDRKRIRFEGTFASTDADAPGARSGFRFAGTGDLHQAPFRLTISGGPIVHLRKDRPYEFNADIRQGGTHVIAHGRLSRPFDLNHARGRLSVSGPDLSDLYFLTGLALPNTPPYRLSGAVTRADKRYAIDGMTGRVGDSDLEGALSVDSTSGRPFLKGDLVSRSLVFEDLAALFGAGTTKASASPDQKAVAAQMKAQRRLFPDATLQIERVRKMDADVRYRAHSIRARFLPIRSGHVRVRLDHGLLTADPLEMNFNRGSISGRVAVNARGAVPVEDLDMRVSNARLEDFMAKASGQQSLTGKVLARAKLHGVGNSVHAAAANASGGVTLVVPQGQIRKAFAELTGINAIKGLILLWSKNQENTELRCAVAHFDVNGGVMRVRRLVIDTGPVLVDGSGSVNLGAESMNLQLNGHPKKFRIGHLNSPIDVKGPLVAPRFSLEGGKIAAQAGIGAALGALLSPLAAILPFVDPGLAKNANCSALVAEQASVKAPVKAKR
jgi:uncharacterized protein involved in outer membrane biogenesis